MPSSLRVGLVGYGYAASTFHAPLIASVPGLRLAAVSSRDPGRVAAALPGVETCDSPDKLFAREDIDLVVIPTPNDSHFPLALAALASGKHVVVDKPFTLNAAEARELIARAQESRRFLSVFHNRRWDGDFLTVRQLLASQALGRLVHFESHFDRYRPEVRARWREIDLPGSGLWYDLGPHLLDQALMLFGPPEALSLDLDTQRDGASCVDWFHAVLRYDRLRVILHGGTLAAEPGPRFTLHGTRGSFVKRGPDRQEERLKAGVEPGGEGWGLDPDPGWLVTVCDGVETRRACDGVPGDYRCYYAGVRDAIVTGAANPVPPGDALEVMRWLDLGLASASEGRALGL
ncbi:oxidoreductase [Paludibacterium paludis]|uniref:Oxidoreductase n=1 Tax=Paludibacterium paludis TaxID=1225769 RepID=A0A918U9Y3_9NEIS|nr:oxidoreductase [Paludibacterium paludis]GGY14087.1 oxidoreductase [Paludibacterium paludis]